MKRICLLFLLLSGAVRGLGQELKAIQDKNQSDFDKRKWLTGNWSLVRMDMKDGSRLHDPTGERSTEMILSFEQANKLTIISNKGINNTVFAYNMGKLLLGNSQSYQVQSLSAEELIIFDDTEGIADFERIRYAFAHTKTPVSQLIKEKFIYPTMRAGLEDTLYMMSEFVFPTFNYLGIDEGKDFESAYANSYRLIEELFAFPSLRTGLFRVSFIVNKHAKLEEVRVNYSTDRKRNERLVEAIKNTEQFWKAATLDNRAVDVLVRYEFSFGERYERNAEQDEQRLERAQNFYKGGSNKLTKKKYAEALADFNKSIEANPQYLRAYFSRGVCYQQLGQIDKACQDWQYLARLGQKWVEPYLNQYCKQNKE